MIIKGIGMLFVIICCVGVGIVMGMYITTQIETQINGYKKQNGKCDCVKRWEKLRNKL